MNVNLSGSIEAGLTLSTRANLSIDVSVGVGASLGVGLRVNLTVGTSAGFGASSVDVSVGVMWGS